jgi:3-oxoadipate enol-lactonase
MIPKGKDILVKLKAINICYDDYGTGDLPVIFIHGFPFDKSSWQPQISKLQESYRVIAYDQRGFGKSTADNSEFSMDLFADDLIDFMDALQIPKAIVCGLSMGGYILLNAVNRYPGRFQRIILADTQCNNDTPEGKEKRFKTIAQIEESGLKEFAEGFLKNVFTNESIEKNLPEVDQIRKTVLATPVATITSALKALANRDETCRILGNIDIPTLILCGKDDVITPVAKSEFLKQGIKSSAFYVIDNAAHLSNLEQPEVFNKHISNFIKQPFIK